MKTTPAKTVPAYIFGVYPDAESRLYFVRNVLSEAQLQETLELHPGLQNDVRAAIQERLQQIRSVAARVN